MKKMDSPASASSSDEAGNLNWSHFNVNPPSRRDSPTCAGLNTYQFASVGSKVLDDMISSPTFWSTLTSHRMSSSEGGDPSIFVLGTNICVQDVKDKVVLFFRNFRHPSSPLYERTYLYAIYRLIETEGKYLNVDATDVFRYDEVLYTNLVTYPHQVLAIFDLVLMSKVSELNPWFDNPVQTRVFNLKTSTSIRNLNPSDIEKMVSFKGMVIRCSFRIPQISEAVFRCLVCGHFSDPIFLDRGRISEPSMCMNEQCKTNNSMTLVHNRCRFVDKQIVRVQETPDDIPEGCTPHTVSLLMHDELLDAVKPGDRVEITGIYRAMTVRVGQTQRTLKSLFKSYIDCLHIKSSTQHDQGNTNEL